MILDKATRDIVLDPLQSFIVQAPAGSGKTELLITRYLRLLATVSQPEEIVALTFTRKAAAEMKNRIITTLHKAKHQLDLLPTTRAIAQEALARDQAAGWHILNQPARLQVLTLDAFCARLLARLPNTSGLPESVRIIEQPEPYYLEAVQRLLAQIENDSPLALAISALLTLWDHRWTQVQNALVDLLAERAQWLPLCTSLSSQDPVAEITHRYQAWVSCCLKNSSGLLTDSIKAEWLALLQYQQAQLGLSTALDAMPTQFPQHTLDDLPLWHKLITLVLTQDKTWRNRIDKSLGFPAASGLHNNEEKSRAQLMNQRIKQLISQLSATPKLLAELQTILLFPQKAFTEQQSLLLVQLLHWVLPALLHELDQVFANAGCVDFTAITQRTLHALGQPDDPGDLLLLLDEKIQHILVDEFQDTSPVQYDLLELLTSGWVDGDGRTLFLVGDPQQSIYGFRAAEVGLFLRAKNTGVGQICLTPAQLQMNFRATPTLVTWYNDLFAALFPQDEDWINGAITFSPAQALEQDKCILSHIHWHPHLPAEGADVLLQCIATIRQHSATGSIAILVRTRKHGEDAIRILAAEKIPLQAMGIVKLCDHPAIHDVLALLRALTHRFDRSHWLAVLRAPWCGLTLRDLAEICSESANTSLCLSDQMNDPTVLARLSPDGAMRVERIRPILQLALQKIGREAIAQTLQTTWLALGGHACWSDPLARTALQNFWQILHQYCTVYPGSWHPELFIERLQACTLDYPAGPPQAIHVLTMHKAKGLEFDHVILFGLERSGRADSGGLLRWQSSTPVGPLLAPKTLEESANLYHALSGWQTARSQLEEERLLYVAITRARQQLHFVFAAPVQARTWKPPRGGSLLNKLWPYIQNQLPPPPEIVMDANEEAETQIIAPPLLRLPLQWTGPSPEVLNDIVVAQPWYHLAATHDELILAQILGTVLHEILYEWHQCGGSGWMTLTSSQATARWMVRLTELRLASESIPKALSKISASILCLQQDARAHWLLDPAHQDSHAEFALREKTEIGERRHVIDRTFIDQGIRWVVDYKTTTPGNIKLETFLDTARLEYNEQLQRYASVLARYDIERFGQSLPIRLGLYFPLIPAWTEWEMEK